MGNLNSLIGRKFRRNKYGLSIWEDTISDISYSVDWIKPASSHKWVEEMRENRKYGFKIIPRLKGTTTNIWYYFDEIIIY